MAHVKYSFSPKQSLIGLQFLFVAFGALVLVPILTGLDANVALFTAGIGTLAFQFITRSQTPPIFLASSFAFIAPIIYGVKQWGIAGTMSGLIAAGLFYVVLSFIVRFKGSEFLEKLFPPVVVAPVIMSIGLILSPVAVSMALGKAGETQVVPEQTSLIIAFISLAVTVLMMLLGKGIFRLLPILFGIVAGYIASLFFGVVNFDPLHNASWFAVPNFVAPEFNLDAIIFILPIAIAPAIEHIGDMLAISNVVKEDYLKKPGLKNTLLGDGVATCLASFLGGPPNTTYSEVTGAVTITKAFNPAIMTWTAIFAIILAFIGKLGGFLGTIPISVMGGIMMLLFGIITSIGLQTLTNHNVDMANPRNMVIVSMILVFAVGGMYFEFDFTVFGAEIKDMQFKGIGLGAILGVILNLILPKTKHFDGY